MNRPENVDFILKDIKSNILDNYVCYLEKRIDKAIEYIKEHTDKLKTTRVPKIDFDYKELLKLLGDKENE